jgi:DNA-binding CsgD family transcriptional regulator
VIDIVVRSTRPLAEADRKACIMDSLRPLKALGISDLEAELYRWLLRCPGSTLADMGQHMSAAPDSLCEAVAALEQAGLITRTLDQRLLPTAPDVGLEALIVWRQTELERARTLASHLMADFQEGRQAQSPDLVEVVTGAGAVHRRFEQLQRGARREVQVLDTPPYMGPGGTPNDVEYEGLARGVIYRGIYDRAAIEAAPRTINAIARYVAAGEQARFVPRLPLKLAIIDREFGYLPLIAGQPDIARFLLIRPCSLLNALLYIFDVLWKQAVVIPVDGGPAAPAMNGQDPRLSADDRQLLRLLAAGMKDQAIASHLGMSYRTASRRISGLMAALGAESRFQAGLYAARQGWL